MSPVVSGVSGFGDAQQDRAEQTEGGRPCPAAREPSVVHHALDQR
ncbi:hypothetical protein [Streptomyces chryseus]|nr:hypothetical protein [Streptomyces chryseus]